MSYKRLLLNKDAVLILPLYDNGYTYSDITTEAFYQEAYIKTILRTIGSKLLNCLNGAGGEKAIKFDWIIRSINTSFVPSEENVFDTTLTKVKIVLDGSKTLNIEHIKDIEITVSSMLFKNKNLATCLTVYIGKKLLKIEPGAALLTLTERDRHYMSQFGDFSDKLITSKDVYYAIQKTLSNESNQVHTILASEITDVINLADLATFEAFGRAKALPAIVKTSLPIK